MKKQEWNQGLNHLDPDLVEAYITQKETLFQKKSKKKTYLRIASFAACFVLIVGVAILFPAFMENEPDESTASSSASFEESLPADGVPSVSVITSGDRLTGKQEQTYGEYTSGGGMDGDMMAPCFCVKTVVEAQLIQVLPDAYQDLSYSNCSGYVAKLRVMDRIRGEGVPEEIFVFYPYYGRDILDGYDSFILSLNQVGVENYMLINQTEGRVDYFPHMFRVVIDDLGYGSVIAFNDGKLDAGFWSKANYLTERYHLTSYMEGLLDRAGYPASRTSTVEEVKANILALAESGEGYGSHLPYEYVTVEEILTSDDAKAIREYVSPGPSNAFYHWISMDGQRKIINYTRLINGFLTDEQICVNGYGGEDGEVIRYGQTYTLEDLAKIPNIGEAIAGMDLSSLQPVHMEPADDMKLKYADAAGKYYKADGKVYGVIRVRMYFEHVYQGEKGWFWDTYYYLYDQNGNGTMMEPEALQELLGEDYFLRDHWVGMIAWD